MTETDSHHHHPRTAADLHHHLDAAGHNAEPPTGVTPARAGTQPAHPAAVPTAVPPAAAPAGSRRWLTLVFAALAQLMIALDATIMNIALPSAQHALGFSDANRQWVITAYALTFGGLLLLGGRIADRFGRRRAFLVGLGGFAAASALGGVAANLGMLITARALQGAFAAVLAPTILSTLAMTFTEPRERAKAFAVFGAIAGSGGALGLVLGGLLADSLGWRWCLYVNLPIALAAATGGSLLLADGRSGHRPRLDLPGALLATGGMVAVVYACGQASTRGWGSAGVLGPLTVGAALLALFTLVEARVADPLLPLRLLRDRNRAGVYLSVSAAVAGMLGLFLFLTYYLQVVLGYSPVRTGLAFLPLSAAVFLSSQTVGARLLPRVPPRTLIVPGLTVAAVSMVLLTRLTIDAPYVTAVLPAEILLGLGMGCVFVPAINTATQRIDRRDMGVASAVVNASMQVGGSIGIALLNTLASGATLRHLASHPHTALAGSQALVHGYTVAAAWAGGILAASAVLAAVLINAPAPIPQARPAPAGNRPTHPPHRS
jgi:EmrB/QacA subfamily drug resistance transporter